MCWPATGGCYVGALGSYYFNNVSFLSYFLRLMPSVATGKPAMENS